MMPEATLERLFAILEEIQDSTAKLRDVLIEADSRSADIAKQDAQDKEKKKLIN
jgi:hypothetical protein